MRARAGTAALTLAGLLLIIVISLITSSHYAHTRVHIGGKRKAFNGGEINLEGLQQPTGKSNMYHA